MAPVNGWAKATPIMEMITTAKANLTGSTSGGGLIVVDMMDSVRMNERDGEMNNGKREINKYQYKRIKSTSTSH
jgi:hypothetical protein